MNQDEYTCVIKPAPPHMLHSYTWKALVEVVEVECFDETGEVWHRFRVLGDVVGIEKDKQT